MENSYGIGITNRFDLFLDEGDDPLEALKIHEQEKEAKKKTKSSEKENKGKPETKAKQGTTERKGIKETQNVKTQGVGKPKEGFKGKEQRVGGRPDGPRPPRGDYPAGDRPERTDRTVKFSGESREERNNRRNREDRPPFQSGGDFFSRDREPGAPRGDGERFGRGGRGGGMGRGMRGGRGGRGGYDNRGKREFDRQSGSDKTGVKAVDKRDGGGAHNWGSHRDDIEELNTSGNAETPDWAAEKPEDTSAENVEAKEGETPAPTDAPTEAEATPAEEEPQEMTLDEWKAMQKSRSKPQYNLRKAGEGEDLTQWKKMYALDKKKEEYTEEDEEEVGFEYDASEYPQRVGRLKHVLDIEVVFGDSRRGGRGRGRGGPRGMGRGRGDSRGPPRPDADGPRDAPRGGPAGPFAGPAPGPGPAGPRRDFNKPHARPPKVDDEHDFPSLG